MTGVFAFARCDCFVIPRRISDDSKCLSTREYHSIADPKKSRGRAFYCYYYLACGKQCVKEEEEEEEEGEEGEEKIGTEGNANLELVKWATSVTDKLYFLKAGSPELVGLFVPFFHRRKRTVNPRKAAGTRCVICGHLLERANESWKALGSNGVWYYGNRALRCDDDRMCFSDLVKELEESNDRS